MKTVHFVRHGETEQNKDGIWQGHTNTQLSKIGNAQAKLLSDRLNLKNQTVFTSDLARAKETAYFLSDSPTVRENLREINVGDFTGKSVKETYSDNLDIFDALQDDTYVFPMENLFRSLNKESNKRLIIFLKILMKTLNA